MECKGYIEYLPQVAKCCFCVKSLKRATILICVWTLIFAIYASTLAAYPYCDDFRSGLGLATIYVGYIGTVVGIALFIASCVLLYSVIKENGVLVKPYYYAVLAYIATSVLWTVLCLCKYFSMGDNACVIDGLQEQTEFFLGAAFGSILFYFCLIYWCIVANSYCREMEALLDIVYDI